MFRRLIVVLSVFAVVLGVGWLAMRRSDISYAGLERVYANADSRFAELPNGEIVHFRDVGPRDAPTLVLVHGFAASMQSWDELVPMLKSDYRVITIDLPAHGLSRCYPDGEIEIPDYVETIETLSAALDVGSFTLVGQGMGGNIAWNYGVTYPGRLDALVLIASSGWPKTKAELETTPAVMRLVRNGAARPLLRGLDQTPIFESVLDKSFADQTYATDDLVERYATLSRAPCHREALLTLLSQIGSRKMANDAALENITIPSLVLHGDADQLVPVSHASHFAETLPNVTLKVYEGVGHIPQQEAPERALQDLKVFLRGVYADGGINTDPAP